MIGRLARLLRPAEWAVICFALYASLYVWVYTHGAAFAALGFVIEERAKRVFVALLIVAAVLAARGFVKRPEPVPARLRPMLFAGFALASLPLVLSAWVEVLAFARLGFLSAKADDELHYVMMLLLRVLGIAAPGFLLWLGIASWAKEHQSLGGLQMLAALATTAAKEFREWWPLLVFIPCYAWMDDVIGQPSFDRDVVLRQIDRAIFFGTDPIIWLQKIVWAPLSEWLAFSYSFYAVFYSLSMGAIYLGGGRKAVREGVTALSLGLAITYVCYSLVPAKGPALSQHFDVSLDLFYVKEVKEMLVDSARITYDCFPSFHVAGTFIMSWVCWRHARGLFWASLPMVASMPLATVYLRYHYVTDVIAGIALFVFLAWSVPRLLKDLPP